MAAVIKVLVNRVIQHYFLCQDMKTWLVAFCCGLALGRADAQPGRDVLTAKSSSGQFVAFAPRMPGLPIAILQPSGVPGAFILSPTERTNRESKLPLDPFLLVISCERIKESLLLALGRPDEWRGGITLFINPGVPEDQGPVLEGVYSPKGWNYQLSLPSPIETNLLYGAVVKALLTEAANRHAGAQSAEVPLWLIAGLSAHLKADDLPSLVLQPQSRLNTNRILVPALEAVRSQLSLRTPLSFQELCWPEPETVSGQNYERYAACAQLFVEELLRLKEGNRCLSVMIDKLPQHLNWQTSFLEAFSPHFARLLDVEKWWGLTCVHFTGVDVAARFNPADSWHKLQEALDVPVEVHFSADRLPAQAEITLQEVISTWEPAQAGAALQRAFEKLLLLRHRKRRRICCPCWTAIWPPCNSMPTALVPASPPGRPGPPRHRRPFCAAPPARSSTPWMRNGPPCAPNISPSPPKPNSAPATVRPDRPAPINPQLHSHEKIRRTNISIEFDTGRRRHRAGRRFRPPPGNLLD